MSKGSAGSEEGVKQEELEAPRGTEVGGAGPQGQLSGGRWCSETSSYQIPKKN